MQRVDKHIRLHDPQSLPTWYQSLNLSQPDIFCPPPTHPSPLISNMVSVEILQFDHSWIFSPVSAGSRSKLSSLNATLNSPAEGLVHSSARAPTAADLNQLNTKLMEVQLSSAEKSDDTRLLAHDVYVSQSLQPPVCLLTRC